MFVVVPRSGGTGTTSRNASPRTPRARAPNGGRGCIPCHGRVPGHGRRRNANGPTSEEVGPSVLRERLARGLTQIYALALAFCGGLGALGGCGTRVGVCGVSLIHDGSERELSTVIDLGDLDLDLLANT